MNNDSNTEDDMFKMNTTLLVENIKHVAFTSNVLHQTIAFVLSTGDLALWKFPDYYEKGDMDDSVSKTPVLRWIPWDTEESMQIQAISFHPVTLEILGGGVQLLVATNDCSLYIIPTEKILNGELLSQIDIMEYHLASSIPDTTAFKPTAITWWSNSSTLHRDIAIIGGSGGEVVFYSLTKDCCLLNTKTTSSCRIFTLTICEDYASGYSYLLITNDLRQQWKLVMEKQVSGESILLLPFSTDKKPPSPEQHHRSRFQEFKQLSVEKFAQLRQRLGDSLNRSARNQLEHAPHDSTADGNSSNSLSFDTKCGTQPSDPILQSCDCYGDAFLSVQQYQNKPRVLTGLFIPESILMLYLHNQQETTLVTHKLNSSPLVTSLLLTDLFIYVADITDTEHRIIAYSTRLSLTDTNDIKVEVQKNGNMEDTLSVVKDGMSPSSKYRMVKRQSFLDAEWSDACLVITNKAMYQILLSDNPWALTVNGFMKFGRNLANRYSIIFCLNFSHVIELTVNGLIKQNEFHTAVSLYCEPHWRSIRGVLKLASLGRIRELLEYVDHSMNNLESRISFVERIHISNFTVMCHIEKILRNLSDASAKEEFEEFLKKNRNFDEDVTLNVMGRSRLFGYLKIMADQRGLYSNVLTILCGILKHSETDKYQNMELNEGFWDLMAAQSLIEGMIINPELAIIHLNYIQPRISSLPRDLLKRIWDFLEPTRLVLKLSMLQLFQSSMPSHNNHITSYDASLNVVDKRLIVLWITTFCLVYAHMLKTNNYNRNLVQYVCMAKIFKTLQVNLPESDKLSCSLLPNMPVISAGFTHAAAIRNGDLYTWGRALYGCLGNGPTLSYCCQPAVVSLFPKIKLEVTHVSCGKHHTIALTDNGVYTWGSSTYGQLGIGKTDQSSYPRFVESFMCPIVHINAGQYHSLAIDVYARLWSWGWGIYGQLGHSSTEDEQYPRMIEALKNMRVISACGGQAHTVVLTENGRVLSFGSGLFGQLGVGTVMKKLTPVMIFTITENVKMISTGYFHNLAVSETNKLYTWGISPQVLNSWEQVQKRKTRSLKKNDGLGFSKRVFQNDSVQALSAADQAETKDQQSDEPPNQISKYFLKDQGCSMSPPLPLPANENITRYYTPLLVDTTHVDAPIQQISCGGFHSALLSETGRVYTWGRNTDFQLASGNKGDMSQPSMVHIRSIKRISTLTTASCSSDENERTIFIDRPFVQISCGKDFTLALAKDGRLYGWGSNNDGQLGRMPLDDVNLRNITESKILMVRSSNKRSIKLPYVSANTIEGVEEIPAFAKLRYAPKYKRSSFPDHQLLKCKLVFPGLIHSEQNYSTRVICNLKYLLDNEQQHGVNQYEVFHYTLECFHGQYDVKFVQNTLIRLENYQAVAKLYSLCGDFCKAFFYNLKGLISTAEESVQQEVEPVNSDCLFMFDHFITLSFHTYDTKQFVEFLKQSMLLWIRLKLHNNSLETILANHFDKIAYPLSVLLFCANDDSETVRSSSFLEDFNSNAKHDKEDGRNVLEDKYLESDFINNKISVKYDILNKLSSTFCIRLCCEVIRYIETSRDHEYRDFVDLINKSISAPNVIKVLQLGSTNNAINFALHHLRKPVEDNHTTSPHYIEISYHDICRYELTSSSVLTVFSCGHNYTNIEELKQDTDQVLLYLDQIHLYSAKEIMPGLFIGNYRDSKDYNQLQQHTITHILSIHNTAKKIYPDKHYLCIPASDSPDQNLAQYFSLCNDYIHAARLRNGNVLVHCLAGMSRSVTVAVAYIMSVTTLDSKQALKVVRVSRAVASPNSGFQKQLQEFETSTLSEERNRLKERYPSLAIVESDQEHCHHMLQTYQRLLLSKRLCDGCCSRGEICPTGVCNRHTKIKASRKHSTNNKSRMDRNSLSQSRERINNTVIRPRSGGPAVLLNYSDDCSKSEPPSRMPSTKDLFDIDAILDKQPSFQSAPGTRYHSPQHKNNLAYRTAPLVDLDEITDSYL